jgi:hypothetical protein
LEEDYQQTDVPVEVLEDEEAADTLAGPVLAEEGLGGLTLEDDAADTLVVAAATSACCTSYASTCSSLWRGLEAHRAPLC